jgi:hypothetical protein
MRKIYFVNTAIFSAIFCLFLCFSRPVLAETVECKVAIEALQEASEIRKLKILKPVPCVVQSKEEVKAYLLSIVQEQLPPEKLQNEELIYKKLGILPSGFNYKKGIVDLYLSQLGGYYDPETDRFAMAGWLPAVLQKGIAAHELTHALQDQYYDLKHFIDPLSQNGDTVLAHSALVEGDATAVMYDYERKKNKQPPLSTVSNISALLYANMTGAIPTDNKIPKSLQLTLIFPYMAGFNFVHEVLREGGYEGLQKVYARPPETTEEVIHSDKYRSAKKDYIDFTEKDLRASVPAGFKLIYEDTMGEFGIAALLNMLAISQADIKNAAEGWGGDKVGVFSNGKKKILVWRTNWDSQNDLVEFKKVYHPSAFKTEISGTIYELSSDL